jgi:hypothetical protein
MVAPTKSPAARCCCKISLSIARRAGSTFTVVGGAVVVEGGAVIDGAIVVDGAVVTGAAVVGTGVARGEVTAGGAAVDRGCAASPLLEEHAATPRRDATAATVAMLTAALPALR